jgi:hypothetical protein
MTAAKSILCAVLVGALCPALRVAAELEGAPVVSVMGDDGVYAQQVVAMSASPEQPTSVTGIKTETDELRDAVLDPNTSNTQLYEQASALFGAIPRRDSSRMGTVNLHGWEKPDPATNMDVQGMMTRTQEHMLRSWSEHKVPPKPEILEAYQYGGGLHAAGLMTYDTKGKLTKNQLGAYLYTATSAVGILFNDAFRVLQAWLGDELASATLIHEGAHARDHAQGKLNPVEVQKGEVQAFRTEFEWLKTLDPRGEKLAWARTTYCGIGVPNARAKAPGLVCEYLQHLAKIQYHGERNDFDGLVEQLGYADRKENPFQTVSDPPDAAGKSPG